MTKKTHTIMLEISLPTDCGRLEGTIVRTDPGAFEPLAKIEIPDGSDKIFIKAEFSGKLVFDVFAITGEYIGGIVGSGNFAAAEDIGKVKVRRIITGLDDFRKKQKPLAGFSFGEKKGRS